MTERRANQRTRMVLPVKVTMAEDNLLVHTLDISSAGARVGGFREQLRPGQMVSLSRGTKKGQFRVIWVQQLGNHEFHVGLEALEPQDRFWGVDLHAKERDGQEDMAMLLKLLKPTAKG